MSKRDRIAELGRDEHEDREARRRRKRLLRGVKKSKHKPQSIRSRRFFGQLEARQEVMPVVSPTARTEA